jgi:hypothetical protein
VHGMNARIIANAFIDATSVLISRPVFTNPVHLAVKPAFRTIATADRQMDDLRTIQPGAPRFILDERIGDLATFEGFTAAAWQNSDIKMLQPVRLNERLQLA